MGSLVRAALAVLGGFVVATTAIAQEIADRIWVGGTVLTMNDKAMRAEAVAEKGGRIVAVGKRADVMKLKGPATEVVDLKGRTLLPGFVDAHGHVTLGGLQALSANLLAPPDGNVKDIPSLLQTLREWIAANDAAVKKVNLIVGFGYDNSTLAERRHPTRDELDTISRDIPVLLIHQSSHLAALNSKALDMVGFTADTPDPAGGVIRRRAGGKDPDGVLEETAMQLAAFKLLAQVGSSGVETFAKSGAELWARFGYTTAQDGGASPGSVAALRKVAAAGDLKIDVAAYNLLVIDKEFVKANASREYVNRFRVAGGKILVDGSPQGFTAWRDRPYYKPVGSYPPGYSGYPSTTPQDVVSLVTWAYDNDVQVQTHANGEAASDALIAALTVAQLKHSGKDLRPVLIHGQFMREDQVDAYKRLNVVPSLFPMHTFYWGDWHLEHTVGPVAGQNISPTGWVRKRGMIFTSHHDAPVAFPDSMRVLDATVTRRARGSGRIVGPEHRVDVITALKAMTIWPAYQHFEEKSKGSVEVGKLADFVILSKDPTKVQPTSLAQLEVTETIKEGRTIFVLDAAEKRKAELMLKPGPSGDDVFGRTIRTLAVYREYERLPAYMQSPAALHHFAALPHDAACTAAVLGDLMNAMLSSDESRATAAVSAAAVR